MSSLKDLEEVKKIIQENGMKLVKYENNKNVYVICSCGNEEHKATLMNIKRGKKCMKCRKERMKEDDDYVPDNIYDTEDEKWVKYYDRFISSKGNITNLKGTYLEIDKSKGRAYIDGRAEYMSRAMARAFKIENYELIENSQTFVVSFKDGDNMNFKLENLIVQSKKEAIEKSECGKRSRQSEKFKEYMNISKKDLEKYEVKTIPFFEGYEFYNNGMIYSDGAGRVLTGSNHTDGYINICMKEKSYKYHRLMCIAFHPIEGKNNYDDYNVLQVNHKDGDKQNNKPDNLEWVTQSENISHAVYNIQGNKKGRKISKYEYNFETKEVGNKLETYGSLAEASRKTEIKEHTIRETAKGQRGLKKGDYMWMYDNEEETEEYKNRYSKHV